MLKTNHMSKLLDKKYTKLIESLGAKKLEKPQSGYTHVFPHKVGKLFLRVDTEGSILSLFGNFLEDVENAKTQLGHWKYNLHISKNNEQEFEAVIISRLS
jgi:hypothetical protein